MPGKDMLNASKATFGEPVLFHEFKYTNQATGQQTDTYYAIFRK